MRRLLRTGDRFDDIVQIVDGPRTKAVIHRASDMDQPGVEFSAPKVTCRVRPGSLVEPGQVLLLPGDGHYLVGEHSRTRDYTTYHLFRTDRMVHWTRPTFTTDPLTGLSKTSDAPEDKGNIWVMWDRVRREFVDLTMRLSQERHLVASGADIQTGDLIDGKVVDRVGIYLGIRVLEVQT